MTNKKIIIKASAFKFPNKEERKEANKDYPKLKRFGFEYIHEISLLSTDIEFEEVKRKTDLYHWDICLTNKLGKLRESYILLVTNNKQGVIDNFDVLDKKLKLNKFLFDFYTEIYHYYFFSVRDIILQILNVYYNLKLEDGFYLKDFKNKIKNNKKIMEIIDDFLDSTKNTNDNRNTFTHRFPINFPDYRPKITQYNGMETYSAGAGYYKKPSELMKDIKFSISKLDKFISDLRIEFNKSKEPINS